MLRDCRNSRVRLRRRLEKKYKIKLVSVKALQRRTDLEPFITVELDMNDRKQNFIDETYLSRMKKKDDFIIKVDFNEDDYCNYTITFLVNGVDIGVNKIKIASISEIIEEVVPELEKVCQEVKIRKK